MHLNITPKAESDLVDIWIYTCGEWGARQADKYLDQLETGMKSLANHPELGIDYSHVLPGYRRLHIERHIVFYQITTVAVNVVRVLHESMDAPNKLQGQ